jgi:hypothetical protein
MVKNFTIEDLYSNCLLASIAHAIMVSQYPKLSNEHSWDSINYNFQNSDGIRGTITFQEEYCIAAFRDENSLRLDNLSKNSIKKFFKNAPKKVIELAEEETLQYLLENVNNEIIPLITTCFWCVGNQLFSNDSIEDMISNGMSIIEYQMLEYNESLNKWVEYYEMNEEQITLLNNLHNKKLLSPNQLIFLSNEEKKQIGSFILEETIDSFKEIGIIVD